MGNFKNFQKAVVCRNFIAGGCKFGDKCHFVHPVKETEQKRERHLSNSQIFDLASMRRIYALRAAEHCTNLGVKQLLEKLGSDEVGVPKSLFAFVETMKKKFLIYDSNLIHAAWDQILLEAAKNGDNHLGNAPGFETNSAGSYQRNNSWRKLSSEDDQSKSSEVDQLRQEIYQELLAGFESKYEARVDAISREFKTKIAEIRNKVRLRPDKKTREAEVQVVKGTCNIATQTRLLMRKCNVGTSTDDISEPLNRYSKVNGSLNSRFKKQLRTEDGREHFQRELRQFTSKVPSSSRSEKLASTPLKNERLPQDLATTKSPEIHLLPAKYVARSPLKTSEVQTMKRKLVETNQEKPEITKKKTKASSIPTIVHTVSF
uniref:C3H1-type domain-containing protein n=1 Tax=Acrobeloides nanus TaxID=290746 RepID=A0A914DWJ3_9BILA